ncbi:MAG: glycosyltransferase [Nitrospirae bacterium]|nr:glycosyltransferase [Nitrospirota bacterium]
MANRFSLAIEILRNEGWSSLWRQVNSALKQTFRIYKNVDKISEEELKDVRTRFMMVIPTMEMGGAERCASILLKHLNRRDLRPELVAIFDRKAFYPIPDDIKAYVLENHRPLKPPPSSLILPHELHGFMNDLAWLEMTALKLANVIAKRQPSVILAQDYFASIIALLANRYIHSSIKLIVSTHNSPARLFSTDRKGELYSWLVQTLFNEADNVIAVSNGVVQELITAFKLQPEKIMVFHNPIDLLQIRKNAEEDVSEHPCLSEDVPVILFVGRLASYKGLNYLLKACSIVNKSIKLRCVLIGEGEEKENLQQLAKELGIAADVVFLGKQQNPFKFMRRAAIFVLPSLTEGLPYVLVEALACGCPIIATDSPGGGPAEILKNGKYGLLVPPGDEKALTEAIIRLLQDDGLRNRFSGTALERAKDFDLDKTVKAYEDIILGNQIK